MSVCKKCIISLKIEYRDTSEANNVHELNDRCARSQSGKY